MPRARHGKLTDEFVGGLAPREGGRESIVRDGALPGFLVRVGPRKRTFELRIEKPPKATRPLGNWPKTPAADARRMAEDLWDKHRRGEPLDDGPKRARAPSLQRGPASRLGWRMTNGPSGPSADMRIATSDCRTT